MVLFNAVPMPSQNELPELASLPTLRVARYTSTWLGLINTPATIEEE